jgi:hypothetical protein
MPTRILDGHLTYRDRVKILLEVELVGSTFKKVVLVDPDSIHSLGNHLSDPSQLIFYATAYCASCKAMHVSDARQRCDPPVFFLLPTIQSPILSLMSFDNFNTRLSTVATFMVPPRYRRPSEGQSIRCASESLMYVSPYYRVIGIDALAFSVSFALRDCFGNDVATYQVETPLRVRTHQAALPPNFRSTETMLPPPPHISSTLSLDLDPFH